MKRRQVSYRYAIRCDNRTYRAYADRDWAEHSAECYADFFDVPVEVFDAQEETVLCTKYPRNYEEATA